MTERPILFAGPMVRAILDGRKTQTRRLPRKIGKHKPSLLYDGWADSYVLDPGNAGRLADEIGWRPGDRAWVRETWAPLDRCTTNDPGVQALADRGFYRADDSTVDGEISRWVPAIHMPRWASRITLEITDVRVQRLQEISEEDAVAEGIHPAPGGWWSGAEGQAAPDPRAAFALLWNSIHGPGAWDANPWVCALTSRRVADGALPWLVRR